MDSIAHLGLATAAFVGSHLLLSHPLRAPLVGRVGEQGFLGLYSLVAAITLGWTIYAGTQAQALPPLWAAPIGAWHGANLAMLLVAILLVGANIGNPAAVDPTGNPKFPEAPRGVFALTRHPLMWAIMLWAMIHAALSPTPAMLVVTGGMGLLALAGALGQDAKKARTIGANWRVWQAKTSFIPFGAQLSGRLGWGALLPTGPAPLVGGILLWVVATGLHAMLGGPDVGPWMWLG
jgi:uncharacterized membrane protein